MPAQLGQLGHDVGGRPGVDHPRAARAVRLLVGHGIDGAGQAAGQVGHGEHDVALPAGDRAVSAGAAHAHPERVRPRHGRARLETEVPHRQLGGHVQGHAGLRAEAVEHAALDHAPGAAELLLGRLEEEHVATRQVVGPSGHHLRHRQQDRSMGVVAAGVHLPVDRRAEVEVDLLLHRQRVDVGPDEHGATGPATGQGGDGSRRGRARLDLQPERTQPVDDQPAGLVLLEAELGVGVEPPARIDRLVEPLGHCCRQPVHRTNLPGLATPAQELGARATGRSSTTNSRSGTVGMPKRSSP